MSATTSTIEKELATTLVEALRIATDNIRRRARARLGREDPVNAQAPDEVIDMAFELQYERILNAIRNSAPSYAGHSYHPRLRTRVPSAESQFILFRDRPDVILSVCIATFKETIGYIREIGKKIGTDPDAVLEIVSTVSEVSDAGLLALGAAGHASGGSAEIGWDTELCIDLARVLLLGGKTAAAVRWEATVFGVDTDRDYVAFRARPCSDHSHNELARELGSIKFQHLRDGLITNVEGDLVGFLTTAPTRVRTGVVGIGPPMRADGLADSFQLATRALETAHAFGLDGVHSFDTLGLLPAILADADVGESVQRRYLQPVLSAECLPDMLATIRTYFSCGMHVERAAKEMFLHPNTLRNRLSKFEELTGAKLRDPTVAIEVWWALQRVALNPRQTQSNGANGVA